MNVPRLGQRILEVAATRALDLEIVMPAHDAELVVRFVGTANVGSGATPSIQVAANKARQEVELTGGADDEEQAERQPETIVAQRGEQIKSRAVD